ncbi:precorrin-6Y C5,15-methyltransferase (decarboxylating) [Thalassobacillus cyri]|uniref:Precorrin-6Y C5,15-methyltransferase (Decarboxylating) n=1 Tax=Thalassobacillus cyri TaxID=571932 RepID=A0A1H4GWK9_9BACI|nr:precorrin-6y C5,15-methyltransferase (decarboxylating) subunit CbiE [Thalassobacillus cyri]SEB13701.1 precorrin-6Y C5,15-methyltransferase (decarboxylating) [Thalassobacillus cyri]
MNQKIKMIGVGDEGKASILPIYQKWIDESDVLVGGERQLSFFPDYQGEKVPIKGGLRSLVDRLQQEKRQVVVLASGDPLFYGIGSYLSKKIELEIYPFLSSIQLAFARMKDRWQDAYVTSVHGRSIKGLAQRINGKAKVALLTDAENNPAKIAEYLLSFGMNEYKAFVAENLGGENERYGWFELEDMINKEFSSLNVVILKQIQKVNKQTFGINDSEFFQRKPEKGLITKKEIRTLSLSNLRLQKESVVWDIGTCTGAVAIEAANIAREGAVYAIEKNEQDLENCRKNMAKFRVDLTLVHRKAPDGLQDFQDPDAVFIGGTAGGMEDILSQCCSRLNPNGRIVLNAATIENLTHAVEVFKEKGFEADITLAQISRSKPILNLTRFDALNPVYIITAKRKEGK